MRNVQSPLASRPLAAVLAAGVALSFAFGAALVTSVIGAAPASAHAVLVKITPAANAQLTKAPTQVVAEFNEPVSNKFVTVLVTTDAGVSVARGKPTVLGGTVTQLLAPGLASGAYKVAYQVRGDDGHPIPGQSSFTLRLGAGTSPTTGAPSATPTAPATTTPAVPATTPAAAGTNAVQDGWLARFLVPIAGSIGLLVMGAGVLVWERRRR